jgi:asparagine synthase (glutamine-hydrolysing)
VARAYWSAAQAWRDGKAAPFQGSTEDALAEADRLLRRSIAGQMIADVPLGAFLSGGIDSSTVVALMQAQSAKPIRTFSIGFAEGSHNEAEVAREVARRLGTAHEDLYVTPQDALALIPRLGHIYCEPFADSSQIPTILVSKMARRHVTVALSGDAGDEVFGGYNRYIFGQRMKRKLDHVPAFARAGIGRGIAALSPASWDSIAAAAKPLLPRSLRFGDFGDKLSKLGRAIGSRSDDEMYKGMVSQWINPDQVVRGARDTWTTPDWRALGLEGLDFVERMMLQDTLNYLPNDVLTKVDRGSMSVALEARVPFLDHRLYEFSASLPLDLKVRDGVNKWLLRELLGRHVPRELMDRPKTGFGIPVHAWLRSELRDWAESLLSPAALADTGVFHAAPVRKAWEAHLSGRENNQHQLWCVLMYQAWHQEWIGAGAAAMKAAA